MAGAQPVAGTSGAGVGGRTQGEGGTGGSAVAGSSGSGGTAARAGSGGRAAGGTGPQSGGGQAGSSAGNGGSQPNAGNAGSGGRAGASNAGAGGAGGTGGKSCPSQGAVSYMLTRAAAPTSAQAAAYDKITAALDTALSYYNCYTDITKSLRVSYEPSVATADGNVNGNIRFGSTDSMNHITAMHEIAHTLGVGSTEFNRLIMGGVFTGPVATAKLREITGDPAAEVHGDTQHFWPYGLNFTSEVKSNQDLIDHCAMVVAIRTDMGQ
jgi:hypothetical protein